MVVAFALGILVCSSSCYCRWSPPTYSAFLSPSGTLVLLWNEGDSVCRNSHVTWSRHSSLPGAIFGTLCSLGFKGAVVYSKSLLEGLAQQRECATTLLKLRHLVFPVLLLEFRFWMPLRQLSTTGLTAAALLAELLRLGPIDHQPWPWAEARSACRLRPFAVFTRPMWSRWSCHLGP